MSAEIIVLAEVRSTRANGTQAPSENLWPREVVADTAARFHFWTGASGKRYVHTVYSLFDCPPVDAANYVLVRRANKTARTILAIGRLTNETALINLTEIRHHAAMLGADEVHIHLLATSERESHAVEADLKSAQIAVFQN